MQKASASHHTPELALLIPIAISILLYWPGMTSSFSGDDYPHLLSDTSYHSVTDLKDLFTSFDGREYRPLIRLSMWWNWQIAPNAIPFHLTNLAVNLGCICLVYLLLLRLSPTENNTTLSFLVATLIFSLQPLHSFNINFICGRTDLFYSFFTLAGLLCLSIQKKTYPKAFFLYLCGFGAFLLALLCKETAVIFPALLSVMLWNYHSSGTLATRAQQVFIYTLPFWILDAGYLTLRLFYWLQQPQIIQVYTDFSAVRIIRGLLIPLFSISYPLDIFKARFLLESNPWVFVWITIAVGFTLTVLSTQIVFRHRLRHLVTDRTLWTGAAFLILPLLPVIGGSTQLWYLYLPGIGLALATLALTAHCRAGSRRRVLFLLISAYLLCCIYTLWNYNVNWREQDRISRRLLNFAQESGMAQKQEVYIFNMPLAYRNAALFSHDSFAAALQLIAGTSVHIHPLSYLSFSSDNSPSIETIANSFTCSITPTAYTFLMFHMQRHLPERTAQFELSPGIKIHIDQKDKDTATAYSAVFPEQIRDHLYFFDGDSFRQLNSASFQ